MVHGLILDRIEGGRTAAAISISIPLGLQPRYGELAAGQAQAGGLSLGSENREIISGRKRVRPELPARAGLRGDVGCRALADRAAEDLAGR
jgi:hypothetical protein